jgi:hypothetical protein
MANKSASLSGRLTDFYGLRRDGSETGTVVGAAPTGIGAYSVHVFVGEMDVCLSSSLNSLQIFFRKNQHAFSDVEFAALEILNRLGIIRSQ